MSSRIILHNGKPVKDGDIVEFRNCFHTNGNAPDCGPWIKGELTINYVRTIRGKPYHLNPFGIEMISVVGCAIPLLHLDDSINTKNGLGFSVEEIYIEIKDMETIITKRV